MLREDDRGVVVHAAVKIERVVGVGDEGGGGIENRRRSLEDGG